MAYNPYYHNLPWWGSQNPTYGVSEFPEWGSENISGYGDSTGPFDQQPSQSMNMGDTYNSVSSGLGAGQAFGNPGEYGMSTGNMLGAVGSGFATGGPIGGVVAGVTNFFQQDAKLKQRVNNINTSFNNGVDAYGRPTYDSQAYAQGSQDLSGLMKSIRPGAQALRPRRRRQMERKAGQLYNALQAGQQNYNQAETAYRDRSLQLQDYYNRQNDNSRMYNLYR